MSAERVREIVGLLYHRDALLREKVVWRLRKQQQPYPADFQTIDGVPCEGQIICGHNPWLHARLVDTLIIGTDGDGDETASWTDRYPVPEMREILAKGSALEIPLDGYQACSGSAAEGRMGKVL
jgi:hypothetical protein